MQKWHHRGTELELVDHVQQLINVLTRVVCLCVNIFGTKMSPLEAIDTSLFAVISRYSMLPLTPWSERDLEDVLPAMNQSSSAITARRKTRFVVRRGKTCLNCVGSCEGQEGA